MSLRMPYGAARLFVHLAITIAATLSAPTLGTASAGAARPWAEPVHILAFGDSLIAGYGLPPDQGFVPQLEAALRRNGIPAVVVNGGVSGDTAAQGRARLGWTLDGLKAKPRLAILALGANDMLRGLQPQRTRDDLDAILAEFKRRGIPVLVAGMLAPPNLGRAFAANYDAIFPALARKYGAPLYPFFLAGVAGNPALNQADRIHPNFQGVKRIVTRLTPAVIAALPPD